MHILLATSYMWNLNQYSLVQMEGKITKSPISTHHTGNRQSRQDCLYLSQWPCMVNKSQCVFPMFATAVTIPLKTPSVSEPDSSSQWRDSYKPVLSNPYRQ